MALVTVEGVSKRYRQGRREFLALHDASLEIEAHELVVVLGSRKSGRSTLLRIAAGIERPDSGVVRFEGVDIERLGCLVGREVGFCHLEFPAVTAERVLDHVALPLLARGLARRMARREAEASLERAGVLECAGMEPRELAAVERVRAAVARALVGRPRLLVADDIAECVGSTDGRAVFALLSRVVRESDLAVLLSTHDATFVAGAERAYTLEAGVMRGKVVAPTAEVVPLRLPRASGEGLARDP